MPFNIFANRRVFWLNDTYYSQVHSQDFYKGGHDDGGTKGPERGAKRRSAGGEV